MLLTGLCECLKYFERMKNVAYDYLEESIDKDDVPCLRSTPKAIFI